MIDARSPSFHDRNHPPTASQRRLAISRTPRAIGHLALTVHLDYLVIGHVTRDRGHDGFTIGGTVSYAGRTARALGCRVGILTSASNDIDLGQALGGILVARIPAAETTTFENSYTAEGRHQLLHSVAEPLNPEAVPPDWRATIVHLGPVARECSPALVDAFGDAFVGVTPQGWMRRWDRAGRVHSCTWDGAERVLARADCVVLGEEDVRDIGDTADTVAHYSARTRLLVVTAGARGCTVYERGQGRHFPAPSVHEVDPTGAGDIFAAVFFVELQRSGDASVAARFANCVAAHSVTRVGLASTPGREKVARCAQAAQA